MSFQIIRNDITKVKADAIVNTANPFPQIGYGTDSAVYEAAGKNELLKEREKIGIIDRGQSAVTPAFKLTEKNGVKYIIHTVGVNYVNGSYGERTILRSCYSNSLKIARRLKCKSIAIPLLAAGFYEFPKDMALDIAIEEIEDFLSENEMEITLVVYDKEAYQLSTKLKKDIQSFIDENYINENLENESNYIPYTGNRKGKATNTNEQLKKIPVDDDNEKKTVKNESHLQKKNPPVDIGTFIKTERDPLDFRNKLLKLIADRNLANADAYRNTNIDRKYFSKMISPKYKSPIKKSAIIQVGLNLKLSQKELEELLATAGYALNPYLKEDVVIKYCIKNGIYSIMKVNAILFDMNLPCLF